jgi:hypothetical protein
MFFVFAGAGLALAALVATAAITALFLTLGTQYDLRKIKLLTDQYCTHEINIPFPLSDLLDQHEEGVETPTDQDVESAMRILEEENSEEDEPTMETVEGPAGLAESQAASDAEVAAAAKAAAAKKTRSRHPDGDEGRGGRGRDGGCCKAAVCQPDAGDAGYVFHLKGQTQF